jgi:hypothetical protein
MGSFVPREGVLDSMMNAKMLTTKVAMRRVISSIVTIRTALSHD